MKMKSFMTALMALAIGLTLFSCNKEKEKGGAEPSVSLSVSPTELVFDAVGAADQTVNVTCDTYWKAYLDADWLEVDMEDGYLNQTITVSILEDNLSAEPLEATLTIVAGRLEKVVTITQAAGAPYVTLEETPELGFKFECEADTTSFVVNSNVAWTATSDAEWLNILDDDNKGKASYNGEGNMEVGYVLAPNTTDAERTGVITVTLSNGDNAFFAVVQKEYTDKVTVTPEEFSAPAAGSEFEVAVASNTNWTVEIPAAADWCEVDKAAGTGVDTLTFTLAANESGVLRTVKVKVKASETVSATITISQGRIMPAAVKKDSLALIAIYNASEGATWTEQSRWDLSKPFYEWKFVTTDPVTGRVTGLELTEKDLVKTEWELPSAIGDLTALKVLKISGQKLQGTIPPVVYTLSSLEQLYFTNNKLSGEIPSSIGNLTELEQLYLTGNKFSGDIFSRIGNLTKLTHLYLTNNNFSGQIPSSISNFTQLKNLYVDKNANMTGTIPATIGQLSELNYINVSHTGIGGAVPSELTNCSKLYGFMAFNSALTSIDIAWNTFTHLQTFMAYGCPGLTGTLPACLGSVTTDASSFSIQLYNCNFTGNVPDNWANLTTKCTQVFINGNKLSGELPKGFYEHPNYADKWKAAERILPQQEGFGLTEPVPNND